MIASYALAFLSAVAPPIRATSSSEAADARLARYGERLLTLYIEGLSQADIDRLIEDEFRIRRVSTGGPRDAVGLPGANFNVVYPDSRDVVLSKPILTVDDIQNKWLITGRFQWRHDCDVDGYKAAPCWLKDGGKHGGADGFAIKVNVPIRRNTASLAVARNCGRNSGRDVYKQPASDEGPDGKEYGVGFKGPDIEESGKDCAKPHGRVYNWDSGVIVESFDFETPCTGRVVQTKTLFAHSWERTAVRGFSIGESNFGVNWETEGHNFEAIVGTPDEYRC